MQRAEGVGRGRRAGALGPPGQVVDRVGQDAQRVRRDHLLQVGQQAVVVVAALECGQQGEPGQRGSGQGALPQAGAERERLLGAAAHRGPVAGDQVPEAQPLQRVDDRHDRTRLPGPREREGVEVLLGVVVTELQGGVAQVPEHVEVVDGVTVLPAPRPARPRRRTSRRRRRGSSRRASA